MQQQQSTACLHSSFIKPHPFVKVWCKVATIDGSHNQSSSIAAHSNVMCILCGSSKFRTSFVVLHWHDLLQAIACVPQALNIQAWWVMRNISCACVPISVHNVHLNPMMLNTGKEKVLHIELTSCFLTFLTTVCNFWLDDWRTWQRMNLECVSNSHLKPHVLNNYKLRLYSV